MRRKSVLGVLLACGVLSVAAAGYQGQQAAPKVAEIEKVKDNLYVIRGGGGNTAAFITDRGVVLVDTKLPGWGQPILDKIKTVSDKPITMVINTHTHGDHTGGQVEFPGMIEVVAQDNTKANMEKLDLYKKPENAKFLPKRTFKDKMSLLSGKDRIELYYFGPGHTNGDAWVVFPQLRAMHTGDMFAGKGLPLIDRGNGGSIVAFPQTLSKVVAGIKNVDTVITGHSSTTMTWSDVQEFANFNKDFVAWAEEEMKTGRTAEQAAAEFKVPDKYRGYSANVNPLFGGLTAMIQEVYDRAKK